MMHSISIKLIITSHSYSFSLLFLWYEGLRSSLSTCQYTVITMQCYYYRTPVDRSSAAAAAKSLQSRLTLCDPTDGSPPGSAIPGILQARTLEWVAISYTLRRTSRPVSAEREFIMRPHSMQGICCSVLESPSSMRLEVRFPYHGSRAITRSPLPLRDFSLL